MVVEVYADLLFFLNAGMDALCFCLTARMLHRKLSRLRLALGAALGGIYAVVSLFIDLSSLPYGQALAVGLDGLACLALSAVVFGRRGETLRRVAGATAVYTLVSMILGGVMTALYNLLNRLDLPFLTNMEGENTASAILFALLAGAGGLMTARGGRIFRQGRTMTACRVTVEMDGRQVSVDGMVDSGNLLRDPIGGKPVVVLDSVAAAPLLSPGLSALVAAGGVHMDAGLSPSDQRRIRLIPAGTATGKGLLTAVLPDRITLIPEEKAPREVDAVIALTDLGEAPARALIPTELMSGL